MRGIDVIRIVLREYISGNRSCPRAHILRAVLFPVARRPPVGDLGVEIIAFHAFEGLRVPEIMPFAADYAFDYVGGERFTMGDISCAVCLYRYFEMGLEVARPAALMRWYRRIGEREAYRDTVMVDFTELRGRLDY